MADSFPAASQKAIISRLLGLAAWYVLPLVGLVIGASLGASWMAASRSEPGDDLLVCREAVWEFGQVKQDSPKSFVHDFVLENHGNQTINISKVTTNCGCAIADVQLVSIPPFGRSTVKIEVQVHGPPGPFMKTATVHYGNTDTKTIELKMCGIIAASAMLTTLPKQIHLGTLDSNATEQVTRSFTICRYDSSLLDIVSLESDVRGVEFDIIPREEGDPKHECDIKVVVDPKKFCLNKPTGRADANIIVRTKHKGYDSCVIPMTAIIERKSEANEH